MIKLFFISFTIIFARETDHLLLTQIVTQPNTAESFSIYNPTESFINLSDYFVSDDHEYYKIQTEDNPNPSSAISGFTVQFPDKEIAPGDTFIIVMNENYTDFYGENFNPDITMFGNTDSSMIGSIGFGNNLLNENSELIILFKWNKNIENLIQDVDYFTWSSLDGIVDGVNKTSLEEYNNDTANENQFNYETIAEIYHAYSRIGTDEIGEIKNGGNGITGHDETSENFRQSWQILPLFNLGCTSPSALNYDESAEVDNESCYYKTIFDIINNPNIGEEVITSGIISDYYKPTNGPHIVSIAENITGYVIELSIWDDDWTEELENIFEESPFFTHQIRVVGTIGEYNSKLQLSPSSVTLINNKFEYTPTEVSINSIINGEYDKRIVACTGTLVDYFDVTVYNGPHALTIENKDGYRVELSIWPNTYDIANSIKSYLLDPPFKKYSLSIIGSVNEYDGEKQIAISGSNSIIVSDTINTEGIYTPIDTIGVKISPAPFILIPSMGETLDFSYSFLNNSRVIVRIFDISGRFITSLVDKYYNSAGIVNRYESSSAWDGRDHLGQIVSPGTYIMHLETINPITGKTYTDAAPIVVGVKD